MITQDQFAAKQAEILSRM
ncbi:MAG: hypothetical protein FWD59_08855 [Micrococcales bacterium]|nr:hypothetical protein [Micrococcales bacterium]